VVEHELKLFNLSKVILDGGWVFDEETVDQALDISGVSKLYQGYFSRIAASMFVKKLWVPSQDTI
jgi:hypothetical protein